MAAFIATFEPILAVRIHQYGEKPQYSHCFLIPVVSALWIYERQDTLARVARGPSRWGAVLLLVGLATYLVARLNPVNTLQHAGMLITLTGIVWTVWGGRLTRALAFPLGYLWLTLPPPNRWDEAIVQPLQANATTVSEHVFQAFGWAVVRQGNVLQLPGLKLLVEEACSGVHSLYALVALGVAWVFFVPRPPWLRALLVAATVPVAVLANSIRVVATGVLAYKVDPDYARGLTHSTTGMITFAIGLLLFLAVDWCLKPDEPLDPAVLDEPVTA